MIRGLGLFVWLRRSWRYREELAGPGKIVATTTAGEQAVMADGVKARGRTYREYRRMNSSVRRVMTW
jgi:hypothetical protein